MISALLEMPLAVHDVEFDLRNGGASLFLPLDLRLVADDDFLVLEGTDTADVEADRGVELSALPPVSFGLPK